jgi:arylsulfatase A-like enzyme
MVPDELCELPASFDDRMEPKPGFYRRTRSFFEQLSDDEQRSARRHYWAFCIYEDWLFGQLLDTLDETGQADNTIVLYCSDHGDYAAEYGLWCKGLPCFRGAYQVPFSVRWPAGLKEPGRSIDAKVGLEDWAATMRDLVAAPSGPGSGRSLLPFLRDESPDSWRSAHCTQSNGNELYGIQRSIDDGRFKYVYNAFDEDELYELGSDPDECRNRAADPEYRSIRDDYCRQMWAFARAHNDHCLSPYIMTGFAPQGPGSAFDDAGKPLPSPG